MTHPHGVAQRELLYGGPFQTFRYSIVLLIVGAARRATKAYFPSGLLPMSQAWIRNR